MGREITVGELWAAMQANGCIDGRCRNLGGDPDHHVVQPFLPPFSLPRYQTLPVPEPAWLDEAGFEDLSLWARTTLRRVDRRWREEGSEAGRSSDPGGPGGRRPDEVLEAGDRSRYVYVDTILDAIAKAQRELAPLAPQGQLGDRERLRLHGGLQLAGCWIRARGDQTLGLSNARLLFSIRLIGCAIEAPIRLNNCSLTTIDLSGSAFPWLDGAGLHASGSVRLRRSVCMAAINLARARIAGELDAADCVVAPAGRGDLPFDADRGVLNLAQTRVDDDVILSRARIWGGLNLRGLTSQRSLFMEGALISSPVGVLEKWTYDVLKGSGAKLPGDLNEVLESIGGADKEIASKKLHNPKLPLRLGRGRAARRYPAGGVARVTQETMALYRWNEVALRRLLSESMRVRTSAVRADGVAIEGSVFARGLRASGRVRMRYCRIAGGVHFDGSQLRSVADCGRLLDQIETALPHLKAKRLSRTIKKIVELRSATKVVALTAEASIDDDLALDMRESRIGGNLSLGSQSKRELVASRRDARTGMTGRLTREQLRTLKAVFREDNANTRVVGTIDVSGANVGGSFLLKRVSGGALKEHRQSPTPAFKGLGSLREVAIYQDLIKNAGALSAQGEQRRYIESAFAVIAEQVEVGQDVDLRDSRGVCGLTLENALIAGDLKFFEKSGAKGGEKQSPREAAVDFRGSINVRSAEVKGDAQLVFSPTEGPSIRAEFVRIGGRLDVYSNAPRVTRWREYKTLCRKANWELWRYAWKATRLYRERWFDYMPHWSIDLRNGSATSFSHPPNAWPRPGCLSIAGFTYRRTGDMGPLAPPPFNTREFSLPDLGTLAQLALAGAASYAAWRAASFTAPPPVAGVWVCAAFLVLWAILKRVPPVLERSSPMAIEYLKRQRLAPNRFRWLGRVYWSLDPYVVATRALLEEGRNLSANLLERERLRQRARMFSARLQALNKLGFAGLDGIAGYGFDLGRGALWVVVAILLGANLAEIGFARGLLVRNPSPEIAYLQDMMPGLGPERPTTGPTRHQPFDSLVYAVDVVVPLVDLGERDKWAVEADHVWNGFAIFPQVFRIIGLVLTAIIFGALGLRAQSALTRVQE